MNRHLTYWVEYSQLQDGGLISYNCNSPIAGIDKLSYVYLHILDNLPSIAPQHISKTQRLAFVASDNSLLIPSGDQD